MIAENQFSLRAKSFIFKRCTVVHSANYTCLRSQPAGKNHTVCKSWWKYSSWRLQVCNCKSCSDILPVLTWSLAQLIAARKYAALAIINIVCLLAAAPPGGSCCNQRLLPFFKIQPSQRAATICNQMQRAAAAALLHSSNQQFQLQMLILHQRLEEVFRCDSISSNSPSQQVGRQDGGLTHSYFTMARGQP